MSEEVEEIENIANKLKEKYPKARAYLDYMVNEAKQAEDNANKCQYFKMFENYGGLKFQMAYVDVISPMEYPDLSNLWDIGHKFELHLEKTLHEKCGCELPIH